jgi:Uma2 family endonuclease
VDGKIENRPPGLYDHSSWQGAILHRFSDHKEGWNVQSLPSLRVKVAPTRYRVPDVTVLDRNQPKEQIITHPPLAVFEVLSPEDTVQRLKRKLEDYRVMGIAEIWISDPQDCTSYRYGQGQFLRNHSFFLANNGIAFDMKQIKELLEE